MRSVGTAMGQLRAAILSTVLAVPISAQQPDPAVVLIESVTVIDGTGGVPKPNTTVLIRGNRIVSVGRPEEVIVPEDARHIDGRGRFLIPGLWDMHVHLSKVRRPALPLFVWHGVTSVRDMGSELAEVRAWQGQIADRDLTGPRILTAGPYLESAPTRQLPSAR